MAEDRRITINMPPPLGWPEGVPWHPETDVLAHRADDGTLYVAPLGSPDFPGPPIRDPVSGRVAWPLWIDATSHAWLLDAPRAWAASHG
jgi:hypothetical protein